MSREAFLNRVRSAAKSGRVYRVAPHYDDTSNRDVTQLAGYTAAGSDLCQAMADEVSQLGGTAEVAEDEKHALQILQAWVEHYQPKQVMMWQHPLLEKLEVAKLITQQGARVCDHESLSSLDEEAQREMIFSADMGITSADFAVAETGSLAMISTAGTERSTSLLPPVHIALIKQRQILPDLFDLFKQLEELNQAALKGKAAPSSITLVSGPSKTGDIEQHLVTGVHGPGQWRVLIIRETKQ